MASRKISLKEAVELCTRSSDEEESENELDNTEDNKILENDDNILSENEDDLLTSDDENYSAVEVNVNQRNNQRQFHRSKCILAVQCIVTSDESSYNLLERFL